MNAEMGTFSAANQYRQRPLSELDAESKELRAEADRWRAEAEQAREVATGMLTDLIAYAEDWSPGPPDGLVDLIQSHRERVSVLEAELRKGT